MSVRPNLSTHVPIPDVHLAEMKEACLCPERFAVFLYVAKDGVAAGIAEVSLRSDHVNGTDSSPVAFLEGLFVSPGERNKGIAWLVVGAAEK